MRGNNLKEINVAGLQINSGSKIAVFVHWSKNDVISNHDQALINSLALEFDQLIVICNLNKLSSMNKNDHCKFKQNIKLVNRRNSGYDFGAYQAGLAALKSSAYMIHEIVLMNNSVYKLHESLTPLIKSMRNSSFDVTSVTNSREKGLHLQSYFLHLKKSVLNQEAFWNWFDHLELSDSKFVTIDKLEIPFAKVIDSFGLSSGAIWDCDDLFEFYFSSSGSALLLEFRSQLSWFVGAKEIRKGRMLNITHYMWPHLLALGCPFLKKDLFRDKDLYLGIEEWDKFVKSQDMISLIREGI